jgi:hypothetical protein
VSGAKNTFRTSSRYKGIRRLVRYAEVSTSEVSTSEERAKTAIQNLSTGLALLAPAIVEVAGEGVQFFKG